MCNIYKSARKWHQLLAEMGKSSVNYEHGRWLVIATGTRWRCRHVDLLSTRLQQIQNSLARAVVKAPKFSHITPILRSQHWLKITERIEYKLLSLTYKVMTTTQPSYLHNLITVQPPRSTRSSSLITLARPSTSSSLWIADRSFQYASPHLWNHLVASLRQPRINLSNSD